MPAPALLSALQVRAEAAGFAAAAGLIRALGPDRAGALSGLLWRRLAPLNKRHARARAHLRASLPDLPDDAVAACLAGMWDNLGRTSAEAFHLGRLVAEQERFVIDEATHEAVRAARRHGAVFVSLHQGNWELASPLLDALGLPVAGVYQRLRNPLVDAMAARTRAPFYRLGLFSKGHETARRLLRILADGGTVTIMADLRDLSGVAVPFFGRPAPSTIFPALLARGRGVPLFAGAVLREQGATFAVRTLEIPVARTGDREADLRTTTAAIQAAFEASIRARPEQWMWGHRRWER
ncbi:lysophospholipid acyltransferase family protein [Rhabdaerophilum calidifontis]|uniref:lysophospholipid acyltransferase family protein n=1 Tax=Rhabdaerophilum calidifontis TaxID=2604328 RepID=UPI00140D8031|nr:lauroyl acyltransferase [Rhabdaerophilum calidifontis]